jgi:hypothetical protein
MSTTRETAARATPRRQATTVLSPTILDVMDHPALFGPHFAGPSWDRWRVFLRALFALPMGEADIAVFKEHTGRSTASTAPFREAALVVGRRGGKSRILALIATYLATMVDYTTHLDAGEIATVAVLAADRKQARTIMRYTRGLLGAVPALSALIDAETAESITLKNRVEIEITTAGFRTSRGYTLAAVLADECAFWRTDDDSATPDVEILRALRPGLASLPSSMLLLASSPYAKRGELWNAFRRHYGQDDAKVLVWRGSTEAMNPKLDPAIIAAAREADPEAAAAEFDAEFRSDLAGFLDRALIDAAVEPGRVALPPIEGVAYSAFCDPSGGVGDSFTCAVAHAEGNVAVLDALFEARAPFNPSAVVADVAALVRSYRLATVAGDHYSAGWVVEAFRNVGITYVHSARDRSAIYLDALPLFTAGRVQLLDHARLAGQFAALVRRTGSGRDRVDHPPGGHDDLANSASGALVLAARPAQQLKFVVPFIHSKPQSFEAIGGATPRWSSREW